MAMKIQLLYSFSQSPYHRRMVAIMTTITKLFVCRTIKESVSPSPPQLVPIVSRDPIINHAYDIDPLHLFVSTADSALLLVNCYTHIYTITINLLLLCIYLSNILLFIYYCYVSCHYLLWLGLTVTAVCMYVQHTCVCVCVWPEK